MENEFHLTNLNFVICYIDVKIFYERLKCKYVFQILQYMVKNAIFKILNTCMIYDIYFFNNTKNIYYLNRNPLFSE